MQAAGANQANSANQIIVYSAPRKQKASFTAHLKPAQKPGESQFSREKMQCLQSLSPQSSLSSV